VYQLLRPPAKLKQLPEHSQSVEQCGSFKKNLDVEGSGSITSFEGILRLISDGAVCCWLVVKGTIIVFSPDSPATRRRRSIGSGGDSSSMLTSVEGNAVQAFCTRKNASN
jgi:hypothetical protein